MKTNKYLIQFSVILLLTIGAFGGYWIGTLTPEPNVEINSSELPPLTKLDVPSQTINGITADLESYYADGLRFIFTVKITGEDNLYGMDYINLVDDSNQFINAGYSSETIENDPSTFLIEMHFETPFETENMNGELSFNVFPITADTTTSKPTSFEFEIDFPIKPIIVLNPNMRLSDNGVDMLLQRLIISPSSTQAYLCYNKPSSADWGVNYLSEISIDSQTSGLYSYSMLFDSDYGDTGKGIEPNWSPPIEEGRCIKLGFPVGSENLQTITLKIPALEQSMPEVFQQDELDKAKEKLLAQGIDMDWQVFDYGNGGGGSGPVYNKLPEGMTEGEAYQKFIEALGYIHQGTWEFTIK